MKPNLQLLRDMARQANLLSWLLATFFLVELGYSIWAVNRGFDFSDEAFGYLNILHPEEIGKSATYYPLVYKTFFGWMGISIIKVRIVRLLALLLAAIVLAAGMCSWLRRSTAADGTSVTNFFLLVMNASLLINATGTQSFTYNIFSTILLQLVVGIFLLDFGTGSSLTNTRWLRYAALGALLFALFTVKFSNAVLIAVPIWLLMIHDKQHVKVSAWLTLAIAAGAVLLAIIMFGSGLFAWLRDYVSALTSLGGKTGASIWDRYLTDFQTIRSLLWTHATQIISAAALLSVAYYIQKPALVIFCGIVATGILLSVTLGAKFYLGGMKDIYSVNYFNIIVIATLLLSAAAALPSLFGKPRRDFRLLPMALFILSIPLIGAFGTNNLLSVQIIWYASFILGGIYILLLFQETLPRTMVVALVAGNACFQAVSGLVYFPYRIEGNLFAQNHRLSGSASDERILVDKELKRSIETASTIISLRTTFTPGNPIFSFRSDYGFIYFLKGTLPGMYWYREADSQATCERIMESRAPDLDKMIFILPAGYAIDSVFTRCLETVNIHFPKKYTELGRIEYVSESSSRPLMIYAPSHIVKK